MNGKDTKEFTEGLVFCRQGPVFSDQVPFDCMEMNCMTLLKKNWWKCAKHVWRLTCHHHLHFLFPDLPLPSPATPPHLLYSTSHLFIAYSVLSSVHMD